MTGALVCGGSGADAAADGRRRNVALASEGTVVVADSEYAEHRAHLVNDGRWIGAGDRPENNRWHAALGKAHPHWVWFRFRQPARLAEVVVHRADWLVYPVDWVGETSDDGGFSFRPLFTVTNCQMAEHEFTLRRTFPPTVTDNFRLRILRSSHREHSDYTQLSEVEIFGEFVESQAGPSSAQVARRRPRTLLRPTSVDGLEIRRAGDAIEFRSPWLRMAFANNVPQITALCWDSLGEGKTTPNLLKPAPDGGAGLVFLPVFPDTGSTDLPMSDASPAVELDGNVIRYSATLPQGVRGRWEVRVEPRRFRVAVAVECPEPLVAHAPPGLRFAFDVGRTPVAPLANPAKDATAPLPCLLHAADFGTLLARAPRAAARLALRGESIRSANQWNAFMGVTAAPRAEDGLFILPRGLSQWEVEFTVEHCAPMPELIRQEPRLRSLPRSWLNTFQFRPDVGILANNVVSDNAIFCMFTFTDPAVFTPTLPGGVEAIQLARESLDRYFAGAPGYGVGHEDIETDTYPSLLISAWDVIRVTGDRALLRRWLPTLEGLAEKAIAQDRNGNGLPESTRSGLPGTAVCPTANWWDQINFGHEDAYSAALSYRAFGALADLEKLARRPAEAERYAQRAQLIRAAYVTNFFNPKTGILAGWKDANGELHDYWFVFINGMAITYGLVPTTLANEIVDRIETKLREVGYTRFDLGLPGNLVPIAKHDYGKNTLGSPSRDDGADTFGVFENGGATACYAYFYIQALYQLGRRAEAGRILWPMVRTFAEGGFQNGVGHGGEWRHWDGRPSGYEGFLADGYYAQMAVFTGHYGITFGPEGYRLAPWSPLHGRKVPLGLQFMGKTVKTLNR